MPNWEITRYEIYTDKISEICEHLEHALSTDTGTDFGEKWMGNLLIEAGWEFEEAAKGKNGCPYCRGSVIYWDDDGFESITVETETAWGPMDECIIWFFKHFDSECTILRTVEVTEEIT